MESGQDDFIPETTEEMSDEIKKLTNGEGDDLGDLATKFVKQMAKIITGVQSVTEEFLKMADMLLETGYVKISFVPPWLIQKVNAYRSKLGKSELK